MKKNIFKLKTKHLKCIAENLQRKIEEGLKEDGLEIRCLPTYITPPKTGVKGTALVLDLGGTNYRTAKVDFSGDEPVIHPEDGWKRDLSVMRTEGFTQKALFEKLADPINEMNLDG